MAGPRGRAGDPRRRPARGGDAGGRRALGRPAAAAANAAILLALAEHRPVPEAAEVERLARRAAEMVVAASSADRHLDAADAARLGTEIQRRLGVKTSRQEPLARFTTMRLGGPADLFAVVHNAFELRKLVHFARARGIPHTLLGRGRDLVISDAGMAGLVVQDRAEGSRFDETRWWPRRGCRWPGRPPSARAAGLSGLEFGLAIPGTVGGAVWANAGAHESDGGPSWRPPACGRRRQRDGRVGRRARPRLPRQPAQARPAGHGRRSSSATFRLTPADPARSRSASRRSATGARSTSRWACRAPARGSATRWPVGRGADRRPG